MSPEKQSSKPDIVSSMFSRGSKKRDSSLFTQRKTKLPPGEIEQEGVASKFVAKKKLPFGLDIGTNSIKIAQLAVDRRQNAIRLTDIAIEELPVKAQVNNKERLHLLPEFLKKMLTARNLKGDCFAVFPLTAVKVNLIKLPQMPPNEIGSALRWEIRQMTQTDISEIALDYIILKGEGATFLGNQIGVLAITAPKKDIFEYLALLESVGLNPLAIDIESLADLAVLNYTKKIGPGKAALLLDFGGGKTSLNIIYNDELLYTRYLNINGNTLTKTVSEHCKISWEEAETTKKDFGLAGSGAELSPDRPAEEAAQVKNVILPLLENMVQDIDYTFKYFSYQVTRSQITRFDKVILSGGSSCLKGLVPFLRDRLDAEIEIIDPLAAFSPIDKSLSAGGVSPRLNVALGLALRGIE